LVIETDLNRIKTFAEEKAEENWKFRAFLKGLDMGMEQVDAIVHRIYNEISSQIDCTQCANCCKQIKPILDEADVAGLASAVKMSIADFANKYLLRDNETPTTFLFNKLPCPLLINDQCSCYEYRPKDCVSYPHLHKDEFIFRLIGVVENYAICPIVFNVYEILKAELWHSGPFNDYDFLADL